MNTIGLIHIINNNSAHAFTLLIFFDCVPELCVLISIFRSYSGTKIPGQNAQSGT